MPTDARERMIESAALLIRERGVEATSFSKVIERSGAPRGSIYHHFPDGKQQLVEEATRYAGEFIAARLTEALAEDEPATALRTFAAMWRQTLAGTEFAAGCPVVAAGLEGEHAPAARDAAGTALAGWTDLLANAIEVHGPSPERSRSLATLAVAAIEGAIALSRARRSIEPLEDVTLELERILAEATG